VTGSLRSVLIKLAVFAAVTLSLTGLLAAVIGNIQPFTKFYDVRVEFTDATGLLNTDVVKIAGVTIGKVSGSEIVIDEKTGKARAVVRMRIRKDVDLPENVHAAIRFRNLLGQRMIVLTRDEADPSAPLIEKNGKALIKLSRTQPAFDLGVVFNNLRPVLATLDPNDVNTVSRALVKVFSGREDRVQAMVADLADITQAIAARGPVVSHLISSLSDVAANIAAHDEQLGQVIDSLDEIVTTLGSRSQDLARAVDNLGVASEGTAQILASNRPGLDQMIGQLRTILDIVAARKAELDSALQNLPAAADALDRATTYGEWTNLNGVCVNSVCGSGFTSKSAHVKDFYLSAIGGVK
jgi:phospholipid/cholesterol/gamma-HCH transport system substrate-binding protein